MPTRNRRNLALKLACFWVACTLPACQKTSEWQPLRCGLWIHKNGDIGFQTTERLDNGKTDTHYLTQFCCDGLELKNIVDTSTFYAVDGEHYRDKNHSYTHLLRADGGALIIE